MRKLTLRILRKNNSATRRQAAELTRQAPTTSDTTTLGQSECLDIFMELNMQLLTSSGRTLSLRPQLAFSNL